MAARQANSLCAVRQDPGAEPGGNLLRVLHLNAGNLYGGVETVLVTLARARELCPSMEPHFAVCYEGRLSRELKAAGVPLYFLGQARMSRPWTVWGARARLRQLLEKERFDLVVCHMSWSLAVFGQTARQTGHRVALWSHGFQVRRNWLDRMAAGVRPDIALANSAFTASALGSKFPDWPQQVVYYPVASTASAEAEVWRAELRNQFEVEDDTTLILQVSRLEAWKGHSLLLEALARLKDQGKWVCWIAGGPQKAGEEEYLQRLQAVVKELDLERRIRFLGQRSDVPKLMAAADVFCQPNLEPEPFGIVFLEALWAGRPVVATAMGGALEIVDESCGLLSKPGDANSLALCLRHLIESPEGRARLGGCGAERARRLCDPATQLRKLETLWRIERRP